MNEQEKAQRASKKKKQKTPSTYIVLKTKCIFRIKQWFILPSSLSSIEWIIKILISQYNSYTSLPQEEITRDEISFL